jgi:hypothetical protein
LMSTILWDSQEPILRPTWSVEQLSQVQPAVMCFREGWSLESALKEEGSFQRASCCCTTIPVPIEHSHVGNSQEDTEHPAHSPGLAPSDFQLLWPLREIPEGRRNRCDGDLKNAVHQWLGAKPRVFCYDSVKKSAGRWKECVE